jgi:hypothetical protein
MSSYVVPSGVPMSCHCPLIQSAQVPLCSLSLAVRDGLSIYLNPPAWFLFMLLAGGDGLSWARDLPVIPRRMSVHSQRCHPSKAVPNPTQSAFQGGIGRAVELSDIFCTNKFEKLNRSAHHSVPQPWTVLIGVRSPRRDAMHSCVKGL